MCTVSSHAGYRVTVAAGQWDRRQTVVTFALPETVRGASALRDSDGHTLPLQLAAGGQASFILPELPHGSTKTYQLVTIQPTDQPAGADGVQAKREGAVLKINVAGRQVLGYQAEKGELPRPDIKPMFLRGGFIHPILSPSGKLVSDSYPPNQLHHHGLWMAWTKTEFEGRHPDFWNMGEGKGTVEFVGLDETWSGPVFGGFRSRHRFVDL
ncbi:MAG: PmoA family protein, partial [Armatimonadota bacterium]|nr:PmoA family protein [Armatimonadota bacterium]